MNSKFNVRRETRQRTESVFTGTKEECINWVNEAISRNGYEFQVTVDLHMRPVWVCLGKHSVDDRCFYLSKENG